MVFSKIMRMVGGSALGRGDVTLLYAAMFLSFLGTSVVFPLRLLYARAQHATPVELGLMASSFLVAPVVAQLPAGWLVDRWGRVPVLMTGMVAHALISLLYIVLNTPLDLIGLRFIEGVSVAAIRPAVSAYIADVTPEDHRSEAYGVLSATFSGGLLIGPLVGGVIGQYLGFAAAYGVNVAIEVVAVGLIWGRLREPVVQKVEVSGTGDLAAGRSVRWRRLLSLPLLGVYLAIFCAQSVMGMMGALWSIWISDLGGSEAYIGATFTVFALPQIFLGAFAGRMSDRLGRALLITVSGVLVSVIYVAYGFVANLGWIMALGVLEGIIFVFGQPAAQGLLADASPPEARGRAQGLSGVFGALGGASFAFASLPLYHVARPLPWILAGVVMTAGSIVAGLGALVYERRRHTAHAMTLATTSSGAAAR